MLNTIADKRIEEAIERGDLDDLPGSGQPLVLDDDAAVPAQLRMAFRVLKNAGFVPPEVQARNEIAQLEATILANEDSQTARRAQRRLALLMTQLEKTRGRTLSVRDHYYKQIVNRFGRHEQSE